MIDVSILTSIVIYHPNIEELSGFINRLSNQVDTIYIVDNGSDAECEKRLEELEKRKNIIYIKQAHNVGVAKGHNINIEYAMKHGYSHVLMFDQDSDVEFNYVGALKEAVHELSLTNQRVGCVGANHFSREDGSSCLYIRRRGLRMTKIKCHGESDKYIQSDYLITSGCLISLEAVREVGLLDEALFVDLVDTEWGLRALSKEYKCFGVCRAKMKHKIGEGDLLIPFLNKKLPKHSNVRRYYSFRNTILLWHKNYISSLWKLRSLGGLLYRGIIFLVYEKNRTSTIRVLSKAIYHGIIKRGGKLKVTL